MPVKRFNVTQDLLSLFELCDRKKLPADQEGKRPPGIKHISPDVAVQILLFGDVGQYFCRFLIGHGFMEHLFTDQPQCRLDLFQ